MIKRTDNTKRFKTASDQMMSSATERMAKDVLNISKIRIPFKSGDLQKSGKVKKQGKVFQVWYDEDYAAYQERGRRRDGSRRVTRYSTPGTGAGFLGSAGGTVSKNGLNYFKQTASQIRI